MASSADMTPSRAIIATEPQLEGHLPGSNWTLEDILVPTTLKDGELLVELVATGICHTDILVTSISPRTGFPLKYPRIAGHEGAGYIKAIGPNVSKKHLNVGDPVLLSYFSCMKCTACKLGRPNYCPGFSYNIMGEEVVFRTGDGKDVVAGSFFGQSSFAKLSVVKESSVVPAKDLIKDAEELKLFSPLGCGLQTGAGSVLNVAKAGKQDSIMVGGLGAVGLAAVMAAKIVGCYEIIGVDILPTRIKRSKEFGVTKGLNTKDVADLTASLRDTANDGRGPDVFIDTTGVQAVQQAAYHALANGGTLVFVGASPNPLQTLTIDVRDLLSRCVKLVGCLQGDSKPEVSIPQLVQYYREGKFPIDRMTKFYQADDFKTALHDMHTGETIKALLLLAQRTSFRPQLPYLAQPVLRTNGGFLGPNPQLARLISTENRRYVSEQLYLAAKWIAISLVFLILGGMAYLGILIEVEERRAPTPSELSFWVRWSLRSARAQRREGEDGQGSVDWAAVGSMLRRCLAKMDDRAKDGKGVTEVEEGGIVIEGVGKAGLDISEKSWPWQSSYYEVLMGCATAAEHLDGTALDKTRSLVFPREVVIGPSNPDPRPLPAYMPAAPKEEDCVAPFDPPETYYMRILTTRGFTTRQKLDAALYYDNWLEFKGLHDSAEEIYRWGVDIAKSGLPTTTAPDSLIDAKTSPVSTPAREEAKTDIAAATNMLTSLFRPPQFPPPPPSGDLPLIRESDKPTCEDSELMLYIGEILFATSPSSSEGLGWTRQAVTVAEANLRSPVTSANAGALSDRAKCKACVTTGIGNWEIMLHRLAAQQTDITAREGGRASAMEWRGWFGRDGGQKGKTLDNVQAGVYQEELKQVEKMKERVLGENVEQLMAKARPGVGGGGTGIWIGG
ncbi:hypothetical protein B0A55_01770 [Friedmanniomyces simplex]|uniref:Enoyl reductase (ER) domain-containing protein n=1 Tax=Friedmanniomyces simplex TaxID=329884 RepID=A0A4U0XR81_9PEZI|nr:hypothetical protein B0A55_01770 [Friedmanniomyces simplex]